MGDWRNQKEEMGKVLKYLGHLFEPAFHAISQLGNYAWAKIGMSAVVMLLGFFQAIVYDNAVGFGVLLGFVLIDWGTGIWAAMKEKIFASSKFRATIIKLLFYTTIVGCFFALERISNAFTILHLDTAAVVYFACTELISIIENIHRIDGTIKLPTWITSKLITIVTTGKITDTKETIS